MFKNEVLEMAIAENKEMDIDFIAGGVSFSATVRGLDIVEYAEGRLIVRQNSISLDHHFDNLQISDNGDEIEIKFIGDTTLHLCFNRLY